MSYTRQLSRWFHKRLYHNFVNAGMLNSYNILLSTVKRDSGLLNNARISQDIKYLERVFEELSEKNTIYGFEKKVRRGRHNQIDDVLYTLRPSLNFVSEMKKANKRASDIQTISPVRLPDHKNM
jgi:stalled ribosome rescue protein Dom34